MAAAKTAVPTKMVQGLPAEDGFGPQAVKSERTGGHMKDSGIQGQEEEAAPGSDLVTTNWDDVAMETDEASDAELGQLDLDLDRKSRQHNLTSRNVRAILHEVITHEHVVAMMKAAIRDTQDLPMFEPKMTRSRLKQAVQQGQRLNWGLSALNTVKAPQFVDIDLEEEEDSSDEEYCPDDEEEEEDTAEEMFLSDADSLASPPRLQKISASVHLDQKTKEPLQSVAGEAEGQVRGSSCGFSSESSFLERLNAVEEELNSNYNQPLDRKPAAADDDNDGDEGCLAFRTRSKLPLVNVPIDQLEAELLAPDITADMYDQSCAQLEEDRHWTNWLQGLMAPGPEDEAEDDDDPEYNFLEDLDEPDLEDYRTDRAVQITKKEVNELLEELFETLQEEEFPAEEEEQEQESPSAAAPKFNIPQALRFEAPLAGLLTERRQTVRKQYEALQQRRALQDTTNHLCNTSKDSSCTPPQPAVSILVVAGQTGPSLHLDHAQKLQLQQQVQQHVQLLTQINLLSRQSHALNHETHLTRRYLVELQQFASRRLELGLPSSFRACNLQGALDLLKEVEQRERPPPARLGSTASKRLLPKMTPTTSSLAFPLLPADTAWLFATRPVFLYPELLPVCSLDPALHSKHQRRLFTAGEDGLIALGLKHFDGAIQSDQLISSYLVCKSRQRIRKRIREMSGPRAPQDGAIKMFTTQGVVPPLPVACSRVDPEDQRPPVDRDTSAMPKWLKNSQPIIHKTRLGGNRYPPSLPPGCTLRLHPSYLCKSQAPRRVHRRLFTLAHNVALLPLAKAPTDQPPEQQPISCLPPPPADLPSDSSSVCKAVLHPSPSHPAPHDGLTFGLPVGQTSAPLGPPLSTTTPIMPCSAASQKSGYFLLQMVWTPPGSCSAAFPHNAVGQELIRPVTQEQPNIQSPPPEDDMMVGDSSPSTLSPFSSSAGDKEEEEEDWSVMGVDLKGGGEANAEGSEVGRTQGGGDQEKEDTDGEEEEQGGDEDEGGREDGRGEGDEDGDKDRRGDEEEDEEDDDEEEEEEDFDDLTQDEDEEEVMSSASEESVLSVPELQETMKQLTWLAAERRLCDADSEDDQSPTSQEDEDEEDDEAKGEEPDEGRGFKTDGDKERPSGEKTPRGRRCSGRGRGRTRPLRGLARTRQDRLSKDASRLSLLYDENLLENDPLRESKDAAFAQSYLTRVREALQGAPEQVQEFVSLLNKFEQVGEGQEVTQLFRKLRCILGDQTDLLRDFAAFLLPEQALLCGLFEEQQAFERSRRFLRQLEISFGDNPSHYQKIIKALQTGPDLSPSNIQELKAQMATLLKGHTHLQAEFWVFFDDLRPPPTRPEQFEEAHLPEEGEGGEGGGQVPGGGADGGFEEVTLPDLEEEEDGHKIRPIASRRQRRKLESHRSYKGSDWSDKGWFCLCRDAKISRHRRKRCSRCHGNKASAGLPRALKSLDPLYSQSRSSSDQTADKHLDLKADDCSPLPDQTGASWESFPLADEKEEEEEQLNDEEPEGPTVKRRREEELCPETVCATVTTSDTSSTLVASASSFPCEDAPPITDSSAPSRPSPPHELPVCAKNISLTASGEKVILWTR
ncbi:PREDICTED: GON-4-like protein [Cyprinodon variegatus]|uniref:GON-4-like protein n=1 Tax=Cyprinodon variegatus TaxID=28743 RepID=A0A3Q2CB62_CYPVA|nr:PREDICTED: GON-4-like protein [Cyprinodon variegatus]